MENNRSFDFEKAFIRLEEILEKMNAGNLPLNDSLKLYEEADQLIAFCSGSLNEAQQKIEILIKNRSGELSMESNQKPATQDFNPEHFSASISTIHGERKG